MGQNPINNYHIKRGNAHTMARVLAEREFFLDLYLVTFSMERKQVKK